MNSLLNFNGFQFNANLHFKGKISSKIQITWVQLLAKFAQRRWDCHWGFTNDKSFQKLHVNIIYNSRMSQEKFVLVKKLPSFSRRNWIPISVPQRPVVRAKNQVLNELEDALNHSLQQQNIISQLLTMQLSINLMIAHL